MERFIALLDGTMLTLQYKHGCLLSFIASQQILLSNASTKDGQFLLWNYNLGCGSDSQISNIPFLHS